MLLVNKEADMGGRAGRGGNEERALSLIIGKGCQWREVCFGEG